MIFWFYIYLFKLLIQQSIFSGKFNLLSKTIIKKMLNENTSVLYQARYCAQEDFSVAVRKNTSLKLLEIPLSMKSYENSKQKGVITKRRHNFKIVAHGSNLFVISESRRNIMFEKYLVSSEEKIVFPSMLDKRINFCVCSFMQKIYVIGGESKIQENSASFIDSCMCYDIKSNKWTYVASIIESRQNSSCAVFKSKIVVTQDM